MSTPDMVAEEFACRFGAAVVAPLRHQGEGVYAVCGWDGGKLVGDAVRVAGNSARAATAVETNTLRLAARDAAQAEHH